MLPLLLSAAVAAPGLLPAGSTTLYGGGGLSTWRWGMTGNRRDPAGIARLDTWAGHGLGDHLQLTGGVPLVASGIVQGAPYAPCPAPDATCDGVVTVGDVHALLHVGSTWRRTAFRLAAGPRSDAWNAPTRARYVNVGQGTWGGLLEGSAGVGLERLALFTEGRYVARLGRPVDGLAFRAPADAVQWTAAAAPRLGPLTLQGAVHGHHQLAGVDVGDADQRRLYGTVERWSVVAFEQVRAELKLSMPLSDRTGLHLAASRPLWTRNGPRDLTDLAVGAHAWFPGGGA